MPEYLAPGVYVEEIEIGAKPIEGVSTSTAAFVGIAEKGPMNEPTLITGWEDFRRNFGDYIKDSYLAYSVYGFFSNGGKRCYVVRIADSTASKANNTFIDGNNNDVIKILASSEGSWGKNISAEIEQSSSGSSFLYDSALEEEVAANQTYFVPKSTKGLSIGDKVRICDGKGDSKCSDDLIVSSITDKKVNFSGVISRVFSPENSRIMGVIESSADVLNSATLSSAKGFSKGSLICFLPPSDDASYANLDDMKLSENKIIWMGQLRDEEGAPVSKMVGSKLVDVKSETKKFNIKAPGAPKNSTNIAKSNIDDEGKGTVSLIRPGDELTFSNGLTSETVKVDYDWDPTTASVNFSPGLKNDYLAGTLAILTAPQTSLFSKEQSDVIRVDDTTFKIDVSGLKEGDPLKFEKADGSEVVSGIEILEVTQAGIKINKSILESNWGSVEKIKTILKPDQRAEHGIVVENVNGFKEGNLVEITNLKANGSTLLMNIKKIEGNRLVFENNPSWPDETDNAQFIVSKWEKTAVKTMEFKIKVTYEKDKSKAVEEFDKLSLDPKSQNYFQKEGVIKGISTLIDVEDLRSETNQIAPSSTKNLPASDKKPLNQGGNEDPTNITAADYKGTFTDDGKRTGIVALEEIDEVNILCIPDLMMTFGGGNGTKSPDDVELVQLAMISHCENLKDRFAILDPIRHSKVQEVQTWRNDNLDSEYAALYYPWIKVGDPISAEGGNARFIPPSGYIAGIYARSDTERGVHKAPANEVVREVIELEKQITKGEQDILNPDGINCIRAFPGRGIRVWGARTISSDSLWKYVNVRRLFLFLEESIDEGTQWVVFEPNDEKLWARVRQTITQFLTQVWKDGALMGTTPEEAFFVKCDRTTMTQNDIDNGRLIVMIGVSPVKPAEFVIFRIAQWTAGAKS